MKYHKLIPYLIVFFAGIMTQSIYSTTKNQPSVKYMTNSKIDTHVFTHNEVPNLHLEDILNLDQETHFSSYKFTNIDTTRIGVREGQLHLTLHQTTIVIPFIYEVVASN